MAYGYGGIWLVAAAMGLSRTTVHEAVRELSEGLKADTVVEVRLQGGGKKSLEQQNPALASSCRRVSRARMSSPGDK